MRFHTLMLAMLGIISFVGCENSESKAWMPPHVVIVNDFYHDVEWRHWCDQSTPCEMMSRQDVYWQVEPDGQVKVMHIGEELRFERGTFDRPHNVDPSWVADQEGNYLLATTNARRALIIHYPIDTQEVK